MNDKECYDSPDFTIWIQQIGFSEDLVCLVADLLKHVPESEHQKARDEVTRLSKLSSLLMDFAAAKLPFSWEKAAELGWFGVAHWGLFPALKNINPLSYWADNGYTKENVPKIYMEEAIKLGFAWPKENSHE